MRTQQCRAIARNIETYLNANLKDWDALPWVEDNDSIQIVWQKKGVRIILSIFCMNATATLVLHMIGPGLLFERQWHDLAGAHIDQIIDVAATFATIAINRKVM